MTHDVVTDAMIAAGTRVIDAGKPGTFREDLAAIYLAMKEASNPAVEGERPDFSRITLRSNIESILKRYRDVHPHSLTDKIMAAIPVCARPVAVEGDAVLSCPKCGWPALAMRRGSDGPWSVVCNNDGTCGDDVEPCGNEGPERATEAEAIAAWNDRPVAVEGDDG